MAIVRPRAPRHILYIGSALLAHAALAFAACAEDEELDRSDRSPRPSETAARPTGPASSAATAAPSLAPAATSPPSIEPPPPGPSAASDPDPESAPASEPSGFHLDDPEVDYEIPRRTPRPRKGRTVQLVLRSSPPGAVAAVDGITLGPTPALWEGVVDSTPREFTFVLPGYAIARYRFVTTRSGIVHGTLDPIEAEGEDGDRGRERKRRRPPADSAAQDR